MSAQFEKLSEAWLAHCAAHAEASNPFVYVKHEAFEAIVALGEPVIPEIIERYREGSVFWGAALARITGNESFGNGVTGKLEDTRRQWLEWWDTKHPV